METLTDRPLEILSRWLDEAKEVGAPAPAAMTLVTATLDGRPSARVVSLKRLQTEALIFTTALWTRKADELARNPRVGVVFHWPSMGRQARLEGRAELAERALAEELFAARPRDHQLQALVSHQGESIEDLGPLRTRFEQLRAETADQPIACPEEWGAIRIVPDRIELWEEAPDRLHDRQLYEVVDGAWRRSQLAP